MQLLFPCTAVLAAESSHFGPVPAAIPRRKYVFWVPVYSLLYAYFASPLVVPYRNPKEWAGWQLTRLPNP